MIKTVKRLNGSKINKMRKLRNKKTKHAKNCWAYNKTQKMIKIRE